MLESTGEREFFELAKTFDREDLLLPAAWAYEVALQRGSGTPEDYIDLFLIYLSLDGGYVIDRRLPDIVVPLVFQRGQSLLEEMRTRFPDHRGVSFWQAWMNALDDQAFDPDEFSDVADARAITGAVPVETLRVYPTASSRERYVKSVGLARLGQR